MKPQNFPASFCRKKQRLTHIGDFLKPKIVWARLMRISKGDVDSFPRFAEVGAGSLVVDSLCFFTGKHTASLCKLLNSKVAAYYFFRSIAILDNGGMQMRQQYVEQIPLPLCLQHSKDLTDADIYKAYGFTTEETDFIEDFIEAKKQDILCCNKGLS